MKNYKEFESKSLERKYIGSSDIASLILVGCGENGLELKELHFGEDGSYQAYIIDNKDVEIPSHYSLVAEFETWLKIYDDEELTQRFNADKIEIYRAGEMGCIIRLL